MGKQTGQILKVVLIFALYLPYILIIGPLVSIFEDYYKAGPIWRKRLLFVPLYVVSKPISLGLSLLNNQEFI